MFPFQPSPRRFSWIFGCPAGRRNASTWPDRISVQLRKLPPGVAAGSIWLPRPPSTFVGGPATAAHASDADTSASVTAPTPIRAFNRLPISFPPHERCPHSEGTWKPPSCDCTPPDVWRLDALSRRRWERDQTPGTARATAARRTKLVCRHVAQGTPKGARLVSPALGGWARRRAADQGLLPASHSSPAARRRPRTGAVEAIHGQISGDRVDISLSC